MPSKKLLNAADDAVDEMLDGALAAHPGLVRLEAHARAVAAADGPREGKVGIVTGGGSGHEPAFFGYVGRGLADAAAVGNVFASPPPEPILACTRHVARGAGALYLYGNYAGDVMNFDMAAELAALEGVEVRSVATTDDVASAPKASAGERRGVAGNLFAFKAAGAAADRGADLDGVERVARAANAATATIGVALGACTLPHTRAPNFELGDDEMEIGMGVHGEPGVRRAPLASADAVVDEIVDALLEDLGAGRGERVATLVNSLGATTPMELYVMNRRLSLRLADAGIDVHSARVGPYCTSLEMAGASITLHRLDAELTELLEHPCDAPALRVDRSP